MGESHVHKKGMRQELTKGHRNWILDFYKKSERLDFRLLQEVTDIGFKTEIVYMLHCRLHFSVSVFQDKAHGWPCGHWPCAAQRDKKRTKTSTDVGSLRHGTNRENWVKGAPDASGYG